MRPPIRKVMDHAEIVAALRVGATVLQDHYPRQLQVNVLIAQGPNVLEAYAVLAWPCVVRVALRHTGELVAQSLPGQPFELDATAMTARGGA